MRKFKTLESRNQISLFPPSIEEYVEKNDEVRYLDMLVDEFDFSAIESTYSVNGRPAFSPKLLSKIILYGKMRGIRSSRELARACKSLQREY